MRYAEAARWVGEHPLWSWARRSRDTRRGLVVAVLVLLAAFPAVGWMVDYEMLLALLLGPYLFLLMALWGATGGLLDVPAAELDERERSIRGDAFAGAYWFGAIAGLLGGGAVVAVVLGEYAPGFVGGVVIGVAGLVTALPTLILAWRLPDPLLDDEVTGPHGRA